jgi:hypothetical protein
VAPVLNQSRAPTLLPNVNAFLPSGMVLTSIVEQPIRARELIFLTRDWFESSFPGSHSSWQVQVNFWQLHREKSPVAERSEFSGNSGHISKAKFRNDISEFESSTPSQHSSS